MAETLTTCNVCGKEIAKSASTCPHCGAKQKKKWGWGKKILAGVGGFFLFVIIVGSLAGNHKSTSNASTPEPQKQTAKVVAEKPAVTPKQETYNWNKKDINAESNGNVKLAIKKMKADGNLKSAAITAAPADVAKRPWDFYGQVVKFSGEIAVVQDYPPGNDMSKAMGGSCAEIVIEADDGTIVDAFVAGSSGSLRVGQRATVYAYPTGNAEVANKVGGKFTHLIVVGQI